MTADGAPQPITLHGLVIPNRGWPVTLRRARDLVELGAHTVWVDDHLMHPAAPSGSWLDAWSVLAAWAASTERIGIGPLVASAVPRPPATLARQALSVAAISGGRLQLGLGAGYAAGDHAAVGSSPRLPGERGAKFRETVEIVDAVLRGHAVDCPGIAVLPPLQPRQERRIPLTIAAHASASLRLAAQFADRWVSYGGFGLSADEQVRLTRQRLRRLGEECARCGRDPALLRCAVLLGSAATTQEPMWLSIAAARRVIDRYRDIGIDDVILYYPPEDVWPIGAVTRGVFEQLIAER